MNYGGGTTIGAFVGEDMIFPRRVTSGDTLRLHTRGGLVAEYRARYGMNFDGWPSVRQFIVSSPEQWSGDVMAVMMALTVEDGQ